MKQKSISLPKPRKRRKYAKSAEDISDQKSYLIKKAKWFFEKLKKDMKSIKYFQ